VPQPENANFLLSPYFLTIQTDTTGRLVAGSSESSVRINPLKNCSVENEFSYRASVVTGLWFLMTLVCCTAMEPSVDFELTKLTSSARGFSLKEHYNQYVYVQPSRLSTGANFCSEVVH